MTNSRPSITLAKIERWLGKLVLSFGLFLSLFVFFDYLLPKVTPALFPPHKHAKEIYMVPRPYTMFGGMRDTSMVGVVHSFNELGHHGAVPKTPKPPNEFRILVFGGSTVLGGAKHSLVTELERALRSKSNLVVRTYNFGVVASILRMDFARYIFEAFDYEPDLLIFYGGGNDIIMPFQADPRPGYPPNFLAHERNPLLLTGTTQQSLQTPFQLLAFHSSVVNTLAGDALRANMVPLHKLREQVGWATEEWSDLVAETYLEDLKRAAKTIDGLKVPVLFVFQPLLYWKPTHVDVEEQWNFPELSAHARSCRFRIINAMSDFSLPDRAQFLDLSNIFDDEESQVFTDGIHILEEFDTTIARAIAENLHAEGHFNLTRVQYAK